LNHLIPIQQRRLIWHSRKQSSSPLGKRNTPSRPRLFTEGGKTIWLAGHVGFVDDSRASLAGDFDAQTRQAFKNLEKTLQRAGGTLKDIVWMTVSVSDGRYSQRFTDIRKEIYGKEFPASTLLTAAAFAVPEIMVEITAIAVVAS
jgi:2-iminobutanoate/2-iminopropanoate deaminase